jgi:hypothetical protein
MKSQKEKMCTKSSWTKQAFLRNTSNESNLNQNPEIDSVSGFFIFTTKQFKANKSKINRFPGERLFDIE